MHPYVEAADALQRPSGGRRAWWSSNPVSQYVMAAVRVSVAVVADMIGGWWKTTRRREAVVEEVVFRPISTPASIPVQPRLNSFLSLGPHGFHRVAYTEWGDPNNRRLLMCMHGFTRNSRDFDVLAAALADKYRVVCMDAAGRGASDWLERKEDYDFSLYLTDAAALLARVTTLPMAQAKTDEVLSESHGVDWIGTSMGGLIGMMLAAKSKTLIRRLVLNDVGALVPWSGLSRLHKLHARRPARFRNLGEVERYLREVCSSFGPLDDAHWGHIVRHSARERDDGEYALAYDPCIMSSMRHARRGIEFGVDFLTGVDLWPIWDRVRCPTLVLRGAVSDLLLRSTSDRMKRRGPRAQVVEFANIGHAPWLMAENQISTVREYLLAP